MTARFIAPTPNCGHDDITWLHDVMRGLWLCLRCVISISALSPKCTRCGRHGSPALQLIQTQQGRLCFICRRDRALGSKRT